jgi:(E)-4-hydroxy-3-methylbut-2-enyl-diphosphate synthase
MERRQTRQVTVGAVAIGGGATPTVQTMTKTDTRDAEATLRQVREAAAAGADIVRVAIPSADALDGFAAIVAGSPVPIVADIHFDHRLAIGAIERGAAKIRINPGNIGDDARVGAVAEAAAIARVPIRVGVNAGSLEADLLARYGHPTDEALCESALRSVERVARLGCDELVVSIKASDVARTISANRLFAQRSDRPLHIGVTEAGIGEGAIVASAVGIGALLAEGVGETIRVSLTEEPVREVQVGRQILLALGLLSGPRLVSCPTCSRCKADMRPIAAAVQAALQDVTKPILVAVMGCEVNGPGEAREADVGIACGGRYAALFTGGAVGARVPIEQAADALIAAIRGL